VNLQTRQPCEQHLTAGFNDVLCRMTTDNTHAYIATGEALLVTRSLQAWRKCEIQRSLPTNWRHR